MSSFTSPLVAYVVNSLWQVPLILIAAWLAARVLRRVGPAAEHQVWVTALLLEGVVPALSLLPWEQLQMAWPWHGYAATADGNVAVVMGVGTAFAALRLPPAIAAVLVTMYLAVTGYCVSRFVWHGVRLSVLTRSADPLVPNSDAAVAWERWRDRSERSQVVLASSARIFAPVTLGIFAKHVLLPAGLVGSLRRGELDTAIAHEMAHIRRNDFAKNLFYEIVSLTVNYHPAVWLTRQRMTETREMICDEMAAGNAGSHAYAESLLRLATLLLQGKPVRVPHAIGIFDSNTLERRLMKLTETKKAIGPARRVILACACIVLGLATAGSALALRIGVDQKDSEDNAKLSKIVPSSVPPETMQKSLISKVSPVYPPEAKKARIQGKVVLDAVVGKTGHVENLKVVSGPNELQTSAMDAVRQWVYKPFLLNGNPIEVRTTISVIYTLKK